MENKKKSFWDKIDKEMLGYDPDWSFDRGIKSAIEWYKSNL